MGMWQVAHWSSMAGPDDLWSIVSRRTDASQYGAREELAIIDPRQSDPIDTSSPERVVNPLWHAMHASAVRNATVGRSAVAISVPRPMHISTASGRNGTTIRKRDFPGTSP